MKSCIQEAFEVDERLRHSDFVDTDYSKQVEADNLSISSVGLME